MHKLESFDMGESMERFSYFLLINLRMANGDEINEIKGNIKLIRLRNALVFKLGIRQEQPLMIMSFYSSVKCRNPLFRINFL